MKREELFLKLKEKGYIRYINDDSIYKYIDKMINCIHNDKPPIIQIKLWDEIDVNIECVSINVRGQIKDGYWVIIDFYSVTFKELLDDLENIENKLITAWNSITGE